MEMKIQSNSSEAKYHAYILRSELICDRYLNWNLRFKWLYWNAVSAYK